MSQTVRQRPTRKEGRKERKNEGTQERRNARTKERKNEGTQERGNARTKERTNDRLQCSLRRGKHDSNETLRMTDKSSDQHKKCPQLIFEKMRGSSEQ